MALHYMGLAEVSRRIRQQELSAREVTEHMLARISACEPALNSYVTLLPERAREAAGRADEEIARGLWRGPLHGVPIAVKDVLDTVFAPTTVGMPIRAGHIAVANATVIDRLENAGAVFLGKLATAEGIYVGHRAPMPTPRNPRNPGYWAGASSSGSGVATAAGLCFGSLGTDTGGSIRVPSTIHGLTGLKPGWGRVSRAGLFALSPTYDHVGPMARSAEDVAIMLGIIAGHDAADPTASSAPVPDYHGRLDASISGLRIGVDERYATDNVDAEVSGALSAALLVLEAMGARIVPVAMPRQNAVMAGWIHVCGTEAALAHQDIYPQNAHAYGPELAALLDHGRAVSAGELAQALLDRQLFIGQMTALLDSVDVIAMPTIPIMAPEEETINALLASNSVDVGRYTIPPNVTGQPAITFPAGMDSNGHPIGMQLVTQYLGEQMLLNLAHAFQSRTDWHICHPNLA